MRVFVTGATGFCRFRSCAGACRSGSSGARSCPLGCRRQVGRRRGRRAHRGDIEDLESLRSGAAQSDGVIHTAFNHDFSKFAANCEADRRAIETLGAALEGSERPLLVTSGLAVLTQGSMATEDDAPVPPSASYPRASEVTAEALAARGVRASTVRLSPSVHGDGDHGFVPMLIGIARQKGVSAYIGDGTNRWPRCTGLMPPRSSGWRWRKGPAEPATMASQIRVVATREIAEIIGRRLNLPVVSKTQGKRPIISASSRTSLAWTGQPPAGRRGMCLGGSLSRRG